MTKFIEFCKEIAPIVNAAASGEDVQYMGVNGVWLDTPVNGFTSSRKYRLKPKKIKIGDIDVSEPERDVPSIYARYYIPNISVDKLHSILVWSGKDMDYRNLRMGLIHRSKEDAINHAKAIISLTYK